jgi:hypothetical protein
VSPSRIIERQGDEQRDAEDERRLVHEQADADRHRGPHRASRREHQHGEAEQGRDQHVGSASVFGPASHQSGEQEDEHAGRCPPEGTTSEEPAGCARDQDSREDMKSRGGDETVAADQAHDAAGEAAADEAEVEVVEAQGACLVQQRRIDGSQIAGAMRHEQHPYRHADKGEKHQDHQTAPRTHLATGLIHSQEHPPYAFAKEKCRWPQKDVSAEVARPMAWATSSG